MRDSFHDLETYCPTPINNGTHRYAEKAEVMLWAYALEDDQVKVWDRVNGSVHWADDLSGMWQAAPIKGMPVDLEAMLRETLVWFQNGGHFDFVVLKHAMPAASGLIAKDRRRDTMVQAYAHALPGALDKLGEVLRLADDERKVADGRRLVTLFCKPQGEDFQKRWGTERASRRTHPAEWQRFIEYAGGDITTMRAAHRAMPSWNYTGKQVELWHLDCEINNRGFAVDVELAEAAVRASDKEKAELARQTRVATDGKVGSATQRDELLAHILAEYGVDLPDMQADTLERRLEDPELSEAVKELIRIRLQASRNSAAKFSRLLKGVSSDGRLRGCAQFRGAGRTGRWAHRMFQPGNMQRPTMSQALIETGIASLKTDCADLVFPNVMEMIGNTVRGAIIAPPGKKLVIADLSNIEGRVAAWLAGEEWKLRAFRDFDAGLGADLYIKSYASSFNVPVEDVPKKGDERQIGKVCIAEGQLVLTENAGLVPIERVTRGMRVWDNVEWVNHEGVSYSGTKEVLTYQGLTATPDHKVWVYGTQEPVPFGLAAERGQRLVESGSGRLPLRIVVDPVADPGVHPRVEQSVRRGAVHGVRKRVVDGVLEFGSRLKSYVQRLRAQAQDSRVVVGTSCTSQGQVYEPPEFRMGELRGAGGRVPVRFGDTGRPTDHRQVGVPGPLTGVGPRGQQRPLRDREPPLGNRAPEQTQHAALQTPAVGPECVALRQRSGVSPTSGRHDAKASSGGRAQSGAGETEKLAGDRRQTRVYDIVNAGPRRRFTVSGKLVSNCELMFGFGGGVGAWITGAATYGIDLDRMTAQVWDVLPESVKAEAESFLHWLYDKSTAKLREKLSRLSADGPVEADAIKDQIEAAKLKARFGLSERTFVACDSIKRLWRTSHPQISSYWNELEDAVRRAIGEPGVTLQCRKIKVRRDGAWLRLGLPSGRALCYPDPKAEADDSITYTGQDTHTRKWGRVHTYGGKLYENLVQAVACDQLAESMLLVDKAGFPLVMHVHDELICETPDDPAYTSDRLGALMCFDLGWNSGLPLAAAGFESYRYRKD